MSARARASPLHVGEERLEGGGAKGGVIGGWDELGAQRVGGRQSSLPCSLHGGRWHVARGVIVAADGAGGDETLELGCEVLERDECRVRRRGFEDEEVARVWGE